MLGRIGAIVTTMLFTGWSVHDFGWEPLIGLITSLFAFTALELREKKERVTTENTLRKAKDELELFKKQKRVPIEDPRVKATQVTTEEKKKRTSEFSIFNRPDPNNKEHFLELLDKASHFEYSALQFAKELNSLRDRYAELAELKRKGNLKKVKFEGYVLGVLATETQHHTQVSIQLGFSHSKAEIIREEFYLYLPEELAGRATALQPDDLIRFEGILASVQTMTVYALDFELINTEPDEIAKT